MFPRGRCTVKAVKCTNAAINCNKNKSLVYKYSIFDCGSSNIFFDVYRVAFSNQLTTSNYTRKIHLNCSVRTNSKNDELVSQIGQKIRLLCKDNKIEEAKSVYLQNTKDCDGATALITCYKQLGDLDECFNIYRSLVRDEKPDLAVFGALIHACQHLKQYKQATNLFEDMKRYAVKPSSIIIQMISLCCSEIGDVEVAKEMLNFLKEDKDALQSTTTVTLNQLMKSFGLRGQVGAALNVLEFMLSTEEHKPSIISYKTMVKICAEHKNLEIGKLIHHHIKKRVGAIDLTLGNPLIHMYARCKEFQTAYQIFCDLDTRDIISWTSLLSNMVLHGRDKEAMIFFEEMKKFIQPNWVAYLAAVNATADIGNLDRAKHLHSEILQMDIELNTEMKTALFTMYAKCGSMDEACKIFEGIENKDITSWNRMLRAHFIYRSPEDTMKFFERMQKENIKPNAYTYATLLDLCAQTHNIALGKELHEKGAQFQKDVRFLVSVMNMYVKCGAMKHARHLFHSLGHLKNRIVWNTMLQAYAEVQPEKTIALFQRMQTEHVKPDVATVDTVVRATLRHIREKKEASVITK